MDTKAFEVVRKELDLLVEQGMPLCGVTVRRNHEKLFEYGVNIANDQRLFLYSCSKPITIAGVMRLYERGLIGLDDPVAQYLPAYADAFVMKNGVKAKPDTVMTIRHLMTMTAGLNYDLNTEPIRKTIESGKTDTVSIVNAFVQSPLDFSPGDRYQYSLAHDVLAAIAEVVSGKPFRQYMHEEVFAPLGMNHTSYRWQEDEIAPQYRFNAESREYEPVPRTCVYRLASDYDSGGAGVVSTQEDLSLFLDAMACGGRAETGYVPSSCRTLPQMRISCALPARITDTALACAPACAWTAAKTPPMANLAGTARQAAMRCAIPQAVFPSRLSPMCWGGRPSAMNSICPSATAFMKH